MQIHKFNQLLIQMIFNSIYPQNPSHFDAYFFFKYPLFMVKSPIHPTIIDNNDDDNQQHVNTSAYTTKQEMNNVNENFSNDKSDYNETVNNNDNNDETIIQQKMPTSSSNNAKIIKKRE
jgi:hypothetical protein